MEVRELDLGEYRDVLPTCGVDVFHRPTFLSVMADAVDGDLRIVGGFKGGRAVGLFPVFDESRLLGRTVTSPPPGLGVPYLGPVLSPTSAHPRKIASDNRRFIAAAVEELDLADRGTLCWFTCTPGYGDPRPFEWDAFDLHPRFTYRVPLDRPLKAIHDSFDGSLRREIRKSTAAGVTVSVEGADAVARVMAGVVDRMNGLGANGSIPRRFVEGAAATLGDRARVYTARSPSGEYLSGLLVLYGTETVSHWQGGIAASYDGVSVNPSLHWRVIEDAKNDPPFDDPVAYDLVGANIERLSRYKSKYGGRLDPYFVVESASPVMSIAKRAYRFAHR